MVAHGKHRTRGKAAGARSAIATVLAAVCLLPAGCRAPQTKDLESAPPGVVELNLITSPVALDLDGQPGPDGIAVKLYANEARNPKPVQIREGILEIVLFDGLFGRGTNQPPVLREFRFTPAELRQREIISNIGTGYQFSLPWARRPSQQFLSVAARFTRPDGQVAMSRPSSVTVVGK